MLSASWQHRKSWIAFPVARQPVSNAYRESSVLPILQLNKLIISPHRAFQIKGLQNCQIDALLWAIEIKHFYRLFYPVIQIRAKTQNSGRRLGLIKVNQPGNVSVKLSLDSTIAIKVPRTQTNNVKTQPPLLPVCSVIYIYV